MNIFAKKLVGLRRWHAIVGSCLLLAAGASASLATEFVFSRGTAIPDLGITSYDGYADVRFNNAFPDNGAGADAIFAGDAGNAAINRGLIRWDLSSLAAGTILGDATLTMRVIQLSQDVEFETVDGADFFDFHRIVDTNAGWVEDANGNILTGPAIDLDPSWNNFSQTPLQPWVNAAGTGDFPGLGAAGDGYNSSPAFTLNQSIYTAGEDVQITVPQAVIEEIIAGGSSHPGFLLRARDEFFAGRIGFSGDASLHSLTIDADVPIQVAELEINRTTGTMTLTNNTGSPIDFKSYSITSSAGALDSTDWTRVVDPNTWSDLSATTGELSEEENPFVDGKQLASGGGTSPLGNAWFQSPTEDVMMELTLNDDSTQTVAVSFVGNGDEPLKLGDLNFMGGVTEADWPIYRDGFGQGLSGLSQAQAYGMGDLNNDGVNDHADFVLFRTAFDADNGAGALAAMVSSVPEPSSVMILLVGSLALLPGVRRVRPNMKDENSKMIPRTNNLLCVVVGCLFYTFLSGAATAQVLIDDHFDNGDIATGGTNGGFMSVTNGGSGGGSPAGPVSEAGSDATITTGGGFNNDGLYSSNSLDAASVTGLSATIVVTSIDSDPQANGLFFGITDDNTTFYRSQPNFGLLLSDSNFGLPAFALVANDNGAVGPGTIFASGALDLPSLLDGFTASFSADQTGWSYEISGIEVGGIATTLSDSGLYPGGFTYAGQFDSTDHLTTSVQQGATTSIMMEVDRMTISSIPEPSSVLLCVFGTAGIVFARKRRRSAA